MKKLLITSFISLSLVLPLLTSAYYESPGPGDLSSNIYPKNPGINQKTTISLHSYIFKLDTCEISWLQDNKQIAMGVGQKSLSFTTGKLGQTISISVNLNCPNQDTLTKNWLFQTNDIEFLVAADTYTPPFYKGNSRVSANSNVKIIAMPQVFNSTGELTKPESLIYNWTKNGKAMPVSSGYGKNTISVVANKLPGSTAYAVEISSPTGEIKTNKSLTITAENPQVILYENKPLLGLQYQKGLNNLFNLTQNETMVVAEPFFFPNTDLANGNLTFSWSMNGKQIDPSTDGRSVTLRQNVGQTGKAMISMQISNSTNLFSGAQQTLTINFGQETTSLGF